MNAQYEVVNQPDQRLTMIAQAETHKPGGKGVRRMDWNYFKRKLIEIWITVWSVLFALSLAKLLFRFFP